jgi:opacity protein-like surface antigen
MELTDGTHYTYSRNVKWQTLTLSYEYEFFNLPPKGISLRAGPTLGLALTKNEIKEHIMGVEMVHHHTVYQNVSSESDLAFTFGLNLALTVYFTDNWFFDTNYRASLLTSHTAGKNQASDRAFKTGSNTNHHIAVSIGVSF